MSQATNKRRGHLGISGIEVLEDRRLLAAGALDPSFSGDGKASVNFGLTESIARNIVARDVAVQSDGKTVVVGTFQRTGSAVARDFAVVRYNFDGTLDQTFGPLSHRGIVLVHIGTTGNENEANAVAIQADGRILVAGQARIDRGLAFDTLDFALMRLLPNGSLDPTFDGDGKRSIEFHGFSSAEDIAIQADGKIVVAGYDSVDDFDFAVARLNPNGLLDSTFNSGGRKTIGVGGIDFGHAVALDSAGNIVVAGHSIGDVADAFSLVRIKPNGALDTTFDGDGRRVSPFPNRTQAKATDVLIQPDGKIVVSGRSQLSNGAHIGDVARFMPNGANDLTFGLGAGVIQVRGLNPFADVSVLRSVDGGLIVAGASGRDFVVNHFSASGGVLFVEVVTKFGDFGGSPGSEGVHIAKGPGRRFVVAGGPLAHTARYLDTDAAKVSIGALNTSASEGVRDNGSIIVARTERLPVPTRVFLNVGGTALPPVSRGIVNNFPDYTLPGITLLSSDPRPFVEIPANQTFIVLSLIPRDDTSIESTESATFSIALDLTYEIGTPNSARVNIADNDGGVTPPDRVGTFRASKPPANVRAGQEVKLAVTWKVPSGGWRQLNWVKLLLHDLDDPNSFAEFKFDEARNAFYPVSRPGVLTSPANLRPSSFQATGWRSPLVTTTFAFAFNSPAKGHRFALEVSAQNDAGALSAYSSAGVIQVKA